MKTFRWMAAVVAAALVLAACGTVDTADLGAVVGIAAERDADQVVVEADDPALFADMIEEGSDEDGWVPYWESTFGPDTVCWTIAPDPSETPFTIDYTPAGYTWVLAIVTQFGAEPGDGVHHLFFDPVEGDVLVTEPAGYDQVFACKVFDEPEDEEEPEGEWCSPGYWRQPHHLDAWEATGIAPDELFSAYFGAAPELRAQGVRDGAPADPALLQVLQKPQWYGGDAFNMVGDLLSAAHPDINFTGERVQDSCPLN